jgi:hypothetical protein
MTSTLPPYKLPLTQKQPHNTHNTQTTSPTVTTHSTQTQLHPISTNSNSTQSQNPTPTPPKPQTHIIQNQLLNRKPKVTNTNNLVQIKTPNIKDNLITKHNDIRNNTTEKQRKRKQRNQKAPTCNCKFSLQGSTLAEASDNQSGGPRTFFRLAERTGGPKGPFSGHSGTLTFGQRAAKLIILESSISNSTNTKQTHKNKYKHKHKKHRHKHTQHTRHTQHNSLN